MNPAHPAKPTAVLRCIFLFGGVAANTRNFSNDFLVLFFFLSYGKKKLQVFFWKYKIQLIKHIPQEEIT